MKQEIETASSKPKDSAQSVNSKTRPTMENKLKTSALPENEHGLRANSESRFGDCSPCAPSEPRVLVLELSAQRLFLLSVGVDYF